jgi:hypothetical protein
MKMSMTGSLGGATSRSGGGHHLVNEDVDGGPPRGVAGGPCSGHHLVDEDIDGGHLGGAAGVSGRSHHRSWSCRSRIHRWRGPWEAVPEPKSTHHLMLKMSVMALNPLRGGPNSVCCPNMHWFLQGIA